MKFRLLLTMFTVLMLVAGLTVQPTGAAPLAKYDINTLAGKVASVNGTAGLQTRFSAFIEEEAEEGDGNLVPAAPINPSFVLSSPLDGTTVAPNVTVNQDTAGAPPEEKASG